MAQLEAQVFKEIGQGGFDSDDFEIAQQLGRISVQQVRTHLQLQGSVTTHDDAQRC